MVICAAYDPSKEEELLEPEKSAKPVQISYKLPDGNTIELGAERFRAPEPLFHPDLIGEEFVGIHECVVTSIKRADLDLRKTLYSNIVLSGGSTLFPGFGDRLLNEIKRLAPKDVKIKISAPPERKYSTWIGGSILASLATFRKMWISHDEYDEDGVNVVHRKTF
jgi:centractin